MMGLFYEINLLTPGEPFILPCIDDGMSTWPSIAIFRHNTIQNFIINGFEDPYIDDGRCDGPIWDAIKPYTNASLAKDDAISDVVEYTGIGDIKQLNELILFRNFTKPMTSIHKLVYGELWPDSNETVEGSREIIQFPPWNYVNTDNDLVIWSTEKGRKINYTFDKYVEYDDAQLMRFRMNDNEMENCTTNSRNCQFYQNWKMGLFNLSNFVGTPRFISKSRFLDASPYFIENSMIRFGLDPPDENIDDDFFDIDPISGMVYGKHQAYQINIQMIQPNRPYPTNFDNNAFFNELVPFAKVFILSDLFNVSSK